MGRSSRDSLATKNYSLLSIVCVCVYTHEAPTFIYLKSAASIGKDPVLLSTASPSTEGHHSSSFPFLS